MQYAAILLCPDGGIIRKKETQEVANVLIGDFETEEQAVKQACLDLSCKHLKNGVISKGYGKGGYLIISTQEMEPV
ncbi:hypothetical protein [Vibrio mimicus]|uniref:hypothetical protein n=1 Tax=Vibrio mimicus TaxID=674 RepID=UPI00076B246E|nr:hypothetical protein [Vibrio mimicus]AMG01931.1 hypothetical protein AL543_02570 [Vibrio mimicus]KAA3493207.1 hypothetical protein Y058_05560 [Vibrio mimicus]